MKLNVGKRILMFLHWLCSLLIAAALVLVVLKPPFAVELFEKCKGMVTDTQLKIIGIAALALYVILAIAELCLVFKRRKRSERGFIVMDSSDSGRVRIAIPAIEQMVRRSVTDIEGITDMKIKIESDEDAIIIRVNASLINGGHVPTVTMNMQQAIRQFVEMNCGVAVRSVPIVIRSVTEPPRKARKGKKALAAPAEPVAEEQPAAPATEPEAPTYEPEPEPEAPAYEAEPEPETPTYEAEPEAADFAPEEEASAYEFAAEPEMTAEEETLAEENAYEAPAAEGAYAEAVEDTPAGDAWQDDALPEEEAAVPEVDEDVYVSDEDRRKVDAYAVEEAPAEAAPYADADAEMGIEDEEDYLSSDDD